MKKSNSLSRSHLETLSSEELIQLADEYGIDVPDDLNRQFIIGDLLELAEELASGEQQKETLVMSDQEEVMNVNVLPQSYNETKIDILLRTPNSLFVWWDLGDSVVKNLKNMHGNLSLEVYFFENGTDEKPCDTFDIQISAEDRAQYVIIPAGKKFVRVDLEASYGGKTDVLSFSKIIPIPFTSQIMAIKPGEELSVPRAMLLSGAAELLREHYNEYRQSF